MRSLLRAVAAAVVCAMAWVALAGGPGDPGKGSQSVQGPELIPSTLVMPSYPYEALIEGGDAVVLVGFVVGEDGSVGGVRVLDVDRPDVGFEAAAVRTVSAWRYRPAVRDGEPIPVFHAVRLRFRQPDNRPELLARGPSSLDGASFLRRATTPEATLPGPAGPRPPATGAGAVSAGETGISRIWIPEGCPGSRPCLQTRRHGVVTIRPGRATPPNVAGDRSADGASRD